MLIIHGLHGHGTTMDSPIWRRLRAREPREALSMFKSHFHCDNWDSTGDRHFESFWTVQKRCEQGVNKLTKRWIPSSTGPLGNKTPLALCGFFSQANHHQLPAPCTARDRTSVRPSPCCRHGAPAGPAWPRQLWIHGRWYGQPLKARDGKWSNFGSFQWFDVKIYGTRRESSKFQLQIWIFLLNLAVGV